MKFLTSAALAVLFAVTATACSDDNDVTAPTDRITLTPAQTTATLAAGGTAEIVVQVTRPAGYTGPIVLNTENLPAGVTGTFSPPTLSGEQSSSMLILAATPTATAGTSAMTIRATGTDVESQTATISVAVGTEGGTGSFTMAVVPATLTLARGGSGTAQVTIDRTGGFNGPIALSASGFVAGVNVTVSPTSTTSGSASLQVTVDANVPGGSYGGTILGISSNGVTQSAPFSVTVLPAIRQ